MFSNNDIREIVRIAMDRIDQTGTQGSSRAPYGQATKSDNSLFIICAAPDRALFERAVSALSATEFFTSAEIARFLGLNQFANTANTDDINRVFAKAGNYSEISLISPELSVIKNLLSGNDSGIFEKLAITAKLFGKKVRVILPYCPLVVPDKGFMKMYRDVFQELREIDVEVIGLTLFRDKEESAIAVSKPDNPRRSVITEKDIKSAVDSNQKIVYGKKGAVTPLGLDAARKAGISLVLD